MIELIVSSHWHWQFVMTLPASKSSNCILPTILYIVCTITMSGTLAGRHDWQLYCDVGHISANLPSRNLQAFVAAPLAEYQGLFKLFSMSCLDSREILHLEKETRDPSSCTKLYVDPLALLVSHNYQFPGPWKNEDLKNLACEWAPYFIISESLFTDIYLIKSCQWWRDGEEVMEFFGIFCIRVAGSTLCMPTTYSA